MSIGSQLEDNPKNTKRNKFSAALGKIRDLDDPRDWGEFR
jgi:hypothetical protein